MNSDFSPSKTIEESPDKEETESPTPIVVDIEPRTFTLNHAKKLFEARDKKGFDEIRNVNLKDPSENELHESLTILLELMKIASENEAKR